MPSISSIVARALRALLLVATLAVAAGANPAQAGQACEARPLGAPQLIRALDLAARTADRLDASGAQVVLLARAGANLDEWGLRWSHLGYAYRDIDRDGAGGAWRVLHKLNACGTASGDLYRQGLAQFFLDDLYRDEGAMVVLAPEVQQALLPILRDNGRVTRLQHRAYNMVAYPWANRYQQSNQWALETLASALEPTVGDRSRAQAWLRFKGYQSTVLHIGALRRLGARVGTAHIAFDDHPDGERFRDRIATVTVESVFAFVQAQSLGGPTQRLD